MHTLLACHWPSTVPVLCFTQNSLFSCSKAVNLHYIIALQFHLSEQNLRSQVILLNEFGIGKIGTSFHQAQVQITSQLNRPKGTYFPTFNVMSRSYCECF